MDPKDLADNTPPIAIQSADNLVQLDNRHDRREN